MENVVLFGIGVVLVFVIGYFVSKTRNRNADSPVGGLPEPRERPGKGSKK